MKLYIFWSINHQSSLCILQLQGSTLLIQFSLQWFVEIYQIEWRSKGMRSSSAEVADVEFHLSFKSIGLITSWYFHLIYPDLWFFWWLYATDSLASLVCGLKMMKEPWLNKAGMIKSTASTLLPFRKATLTWNHSIEGGQQKFLKKSNLPEPACPFHAMLVWMRVVYLLIDPSSFQ